MWLLNMWLCRRVLEHAGQGVDVTLHAVADSVGLHCCQSYCCHQCPCLCSHAHAGAPVRALAVLADANLLIRMPSAHVNSTALLTVMQ